MNKVIRFGLISHGIRARATFTLTWLAKDPYGSERRSMDEPFPVDFTNDQQFSIPTKIQPKPEENYVCKFLPQCKCFHILS